MEFLKIIALILIIFVCFIYILTKYRAAIDKRDAAFALRLGAGSILNEKKPSAFWYLFK